MNNTYSFNASVVAPQPVVQTVTILSPPIFLEEPDSFLELYVGENKTYKLPPYSDPQNLDCTLSLKYIDTLGSTFIKLNPSSNDLKLSPLNDWQAGFFRFKIKITNANQSSSTYLFNLHVIDPDSDNYYNKT
jgi:hypothetical protein